MSEHAIIKFPYDSRVRYLPLAYFLPQEEVARYPALHKLPRDFSNLADSSEGIALILSDAFLKDIMDATAALVFPHFGFGGWIEHYSGHFPAWKLAYSLPLWAKLLEQETGWGVQALFRTPPHTEIPFFESAYIEEVMQRMVRRAVKEEGWQPILNLVKEMPCEEDFEKWDTNVRKDFLRKWYHTRSKRVKIVSLEALMEDKEHGIYEIEDMSSVFEDRVVAEDYVQRFRAWLPIKDMEILELRVEGFTYAEIAYKLGYQNHSGVLKRMRTIKKKFLEYEERAERL
jgi:hypothetical protein